MTERLPTLKLTPDEYKKLAEVVEADIGSERLANLLGQMFAPSDILKMIRREAPVKEITKKDTAILVRGLADLHEGDREADIAWAISVAQRTFATEARAVEVINFATQRIQQFEDAEAAGVVKEPIDLLKVVQTGKNPVDYSRMVMEDVLDFANLEGGGVRSRATLSSAYWGGNDSKMGGLGRYHCFWMDGNQLFGGHFDWVRKGGQPFKTTEKIASGYLGKVPPAGSTMYFCMISNDGKRRTDVVESKTKWKG